MQKEEIAQCISAAENLMINLIEMSRNSEQFNLDQTLEHFSASVSLVAGQIALFQLEENNVEIRETMGQILSSLRKNLATVTQFNETTLQADCKKSEVFH